MIRHQGHYTPPFFLFNGHLETIYPALLRKVALPPYQRERILTPDQDFLDLDWIKNGSEKLLIISHGLEGNSNRAYIKGMAKAGIEMRCDILAWNYRGCSDEMNRQLRFYHSGATDDLGLIVNHALTNFHYKEIFLVGFSLGGNLTLKYLGENNALPETIKKAVVFSVPLDLQSSCIKISRSENWIYSRRFLRSLKEKVIRKASLIKDLDIKGINKIATLMEFDDHFTAPLHGFRNAEDYYHRCSSIHFVRQIRIPTLIVNALNDPFLSPECHPQSLLHDHPSVQLESPVRGGHVGFVEFNNKGLYWSDQRAIFFLGQKDV